MVVEVREWGGLEEELDVFEKVGEGKEPLTLPLHERNLIRVGVMIYELGVEENHELVKVSPWLDDVFG